MHVKVIAPHCPVSRHDNFVVPDGLYPLLQVCVAVAPYVELASTSRRVWPLSGLGNVFPQSTKLAEFTRRELQRRQGTISKNVLRKNKPHCLDVQYCVATILSEMIYICSVPVR